MSSVVDSHHHSWKYRAGEYSWMDDGYDGLRQDFTVTEYGQEAALSEVTAAVLVQARQSRAENAYLLDEASRSRCQEFVVGWVDLRSENVEEAVAELAADPRVVGARHFISLEPNYAELVDARFVRGLGVLARHDLTFDLLLRADQLKAVAAVVRRVPQLTFVLDHLGNPPVRGDDQAWYRDLASLAEVPNVNAKVSGLLTVIPTTGPVRGLLRPYLRHAVDCFGPQRLLFGSDWPVVTMGGTVESWLALVSEFVDDEMPGQSEALMGANAVRIYGLDKRGLVP